MNMQIRVSYVQNCVKIYCLIYSNILTTLHVSNIYYRLSIDKIVITFLKYREILNLVLTDECWLSIVYISEKILLIQ